MQDKKNIELIEEIKEQLKAFESTPYKKGAWESYQATYGMGTKHRKLAGWYWSAAAAMAIVGFGSLFLMNKDNATKSPLSTIALTTVKEKGSPVALEQPSDFNISSPLAQNNLIPEQENQIMVAAVGSTQEVQSKGGEMLQLDLLRTAGIMSSGYDLHLSNKHINNAPSLRELAAPHVWMYGLDHEPTDMTMGFVAAQQQLGMEQDNQAIKLSPKKFKLMDKLALGAFLSPTSTDNKVDLGGGLLLAYQLTDKLALRTGAAFNQYEVGILPSKISGKKNIHDRPQDSPVSSDMPYRVTASLPNINAVTGKVQTLDIPLEVEYKLSKQFYTSVGVSYAAVLSQERFNHYQELADPLMFSTTSDTGKPTNEEIKVVDKKIASNEGNVETNGFGGFINLSIGRKTNISKTFKMSVEPYVKFPVGQFKRADMNYTNGGIKIITNF